MAEDQEHNELPAYDSDEEGKDENQKKFQGGLNSNNHEPGYVGIHATGFKDFMLKPELIRAIGEAGFENPSEVQQECTKKIFINYDGIPVATLGTDLLCQAKSGMGKTAVFVLSILHQLPSKDLTPVSALILCHTRELAYQINKEIVRLGKYLQEITSRYFYGGEDISDQIKILKSNPPTIVVGTPGRILDLTNKGHLKLDKLKFFILDECDKMLDQLDMRGDVQDIFKKTPHNKQVMMFSATMSGNIKKVCRKFMQKQTEVFIDDETKLTLHGLQQYYINIQENEKNRKLNDLLDALLFNQVIIFVKNQQRASYLNKLLDECNFPSITIHAGLSQQDRIAKYDMFKQFKKRIMVATDVLGRGIDIERVNIVINYDMPENSDTYLHRVGRAGRFGTKGLAITFVANDEENKILKEIQDRFAVKITDLPDTIDTSQYMNN